MGKRVEGISMDDPIKLSEYDIEKLYEARLIFLADITYMTGFKHPENCQKAIKKFFGYSASWLRRG